MLYIIAVTYPPVHVTRENVTLAATEVTYPPVHIPCENVTYERGGILIQCR